MRHSERHYSQRIGWLRAAVLGANDGVVSTASLIVGVAAAGTDRGAVLLAGIAGLVAGAMSMAAGEYVSVSSQADTEAADLAREREELQTNEDYEREELARIYMARGLDAALAQQVSAQLMAHDALGAHARDELGLSEIHRARPLQAALASATSFAAGAVIPVIMAALLPVGRIAALVAAGSLLLLALLGGLAAGAGGARILLGAVRICFWGALAMGVTAVIGAVLGTNVS
jgi:VIT1/CCC1 family predicted Fe2+/Mn2+ transporter